MTWLDSLNGGALIAYLILATVALTALVAMLMHLASWAADRGSKHLARWHARLILRDGPIRYGEPSPVVWPLVVVGAVSAITLAIWLAA